MSRRGVPESQHRESVHGRVDGVSDWMTDDRGRERSSHNGPHEDTPSSHITGLGTPLISSPYDYAFSSTLNHQDVPSYHKEDEFKDLNDHYHRIISNSKHTINGTDASSEMELVRLMQKLHLTGEQLKAPQFQAIY